jgi:hypothetical protein
MQISTVIAYPERFGLTEEEIQAVYGRHVGWKKLGKKHNMMLEAGQHGPIKLCCNSRWMSRHGGK